MSNFYTIILFKTRPNKVGLSSKKRTLGIDIENAPKHKELVPKFDVIEKLEEISEMKAEVPLIRF